MKSTFNLAVVADNGVGGTEKAAVLFAGELARRGHRVVFVTGPGPRDLLLEQGNVRKIAPPGDAAGLAQLLKTERIDVIHQHVPGYRMPNPIYDALRILGEQRPRLVETNVFGRFEDPEGDKWVDFRCFVSCSSAVQAFQRSGRTLSLESLDNLSVLFNPLALLDFTSQQRLRRSAMREEFGIRPEEIFVVRFGRPGKKWNRDEVRVFQQAHRKNPLLRLLLMEPSPDIWREVESGAWGEGILLRRTLSDFDRLSSLYTAGDLMLHLPDWGESYGYTMAEAMQHGLPLIVNSTPWCDNAQVELVENGVTGFVCNSCDGAVNALLRLAGDADLRQRMGGAAVARIDLFSNLVKEADLLEEIINHVVGGGPLPKTSQRREELLRFQASFAEREKKVFEAETPGHRLAYWKGRCYGALRKTRGKAGQLKRAWAASRGG